MLLAHYAVWHLLKVDFSQKKEKKNTKFSRIISILFFFPFSLWAPCHVALTIATKPNDTVHITYFMYTNSSYIHCSVSVVISFSMVLRCSFPLTSPLFKETRSDSWDMLSRCSPSGLSLLCMFNNTATWPSFSVSWILGSRNLNKAFNI